MGKTKKKKKSSYNVLFVPNNNSDGIKQFSISMEVLVSFLAAVAFLIMAALIYCFLLVRELNNENSKMLKLQSQIDEMTQQTSELTAKNEELQKKVAILSHTVNEKVQQEEQREAEIAQGYIPTGFPIKGTASYDEQENELEGNPIVLFHAAQGTSVIAAASGTVSSIAGNSEAGYIVMIDHGNGYFSVYRNGTEPKLEEGDEVTTATEIFMIEAGYEELGYQIIENEVYIDPLELMEIYG